MISECGNIVTLPTADLVISRYQMRLSSLAMGTMDAVLINHFDCNDSAILSIIGCLTGWIRQVWVDRWIWAADKCVTAKCNPIKSCLIRGK